MMKKHKNHRGALLVYSALVLSSTLVITLAIAAIFLPRIRLSLDVSRSTNAIFAADSAMEWCLFNQRGRPWPGGYQNTMTMENGATFTMEYNSSSIASCTTAQTPLNHRTVGTHSGVSRAYELAE